MVASVVTDKLDGIVALCRTYDVAYLDVFGSAVDGRFDERDLSDVDFLVEFRNPSSELFSRYLDLYADLGKLLDRDVDLIIDSTLRPGDMRNHVEASRIRLYG